MTVFSRLLLWYTILETEFDDISVKLGDKSGAKLGLAFCRCCLDRRLCNQCSILLQDPLLNEEEEEDEEAPEKPQRAVCSAKMPGFIVNAAILIPSRGFILYICDVFRRGKLRAPAKRQ